MLIAIRPHEGSFSLSRGGSSAFVVVFVFVNSRRAALAGFVITEPIRGSPRLLGRLFVRVVGVSVAFHLPAQTGVEFRVQLRADARLPERA